MPEIRGPKPKPFRAIAPDGEVFVCDTGVPEFAKEHGLQQPAIYLCLNGRAGSHKGWRFQRLVTGEGGEPVAVKVGPVRPLDGLDASYVERRRREIWDGLERLGQRTRSILNGDEPSPPNWDPKKILEVFRVEAESLGLSLKHVADARTEAEKFADAVDKLHQLDDMWESMEELLTALETQFDRATQMGEAYFLERNEQAGGGGAIDPKAWKETVQTWMGRLRMMKRVIERARNDTDPMALPSQQRVSEATSLLRYMLFVMRSDFDTGLPGNIFVIGKHLVKMSVDLWEAENRCEWTPYGPRKPLEQRDGRDRMSRPIADGVEYDGAMLIYPPRHSKTSVLRAWACRKISRDQRTQLAYIHDMDDEASKFNRYVSSAFNRTTDTGKRNYSLYKFSLAPYDNDSTTLRLQVDDPPKCPNLTCATVWSSKLGINLDGLIVDDVVPKKDQDQPTLRERRKSQFKRVWLTRFQGSRGFYIVAGYPWHHEDLVWDTYQEAKRWVRTGGKNGQCLRVSRMAVGGPSTSPPFHSIWPEMYPPKELRRRYMMMNDAAGWAANWMLNPITDDLRIVKKVRLYDPMKPEYQECIRNGSVHLSLDPAATNRAGSDRAGLIRAVVGEVVVRTQEDWGERVQSETMMLVLDAEEFHATQAEAADRMAKIGQSSKVDLVHIEVAGGYGTSARDLLSNLHGVASIVEHKPGFRNKEQRLRSVAPLLEDGSAGIRAKVAFPGVMEGGELVLDERCRKVVDYVVNFRVTNGHHSLDALTQLCKHVAGSLGAGEGAVSSEIREAQADRRNRLQRMYDDMAQADREFEEAGVVAWAEGSGA